MNYEFFDLPEDFLHQLKDKIEKVTAEDVVAAAKKNLQPEKLQVLVVGKVTDFEVPPEELGLGPVTEIDITIPSGEEERELAITPENLAKGKEILDKAVIAHGGLENFKKARSTSTKGTLTFVTPQGEFPISFEEVFVLPNKRSQIASVFGQKIYDIQDGSSGWKTDQRTMTMVAKTEDDNIGDSKRLARNNIVVFRQADDPAFQVVFDGTGTVNDGAVDFVALVDSEGELMCRFGFNTDSHQLICKYATQETPMGEGTVEQVFGDFVEIDGLLIPMTSVRSLNNQKIGELKYSEFLINAEIPTDAFAKPE